MMDWTDRHCRYFHRLINPNVVLYTEMIHANAVINGDREYLLAFNEIEHPVVVQLGGNDPQQLALAAKICADFGYDQINLNVGCPSDRVQEGAFGACLMKQPALVARCVEAMKQAVVIPVTVKTRIGVDEFDSFEFLSDFVCHQIKVGVDTMIVHARIALLSGLSPKENRSVPPLNYDRVARIKSRYAQLPIVLNGGIQHVHDIEMALEQFDGAMLGRAAYHNPWLLSELKCLDVADDDNEGCRPTGRLTREQVLAKFVTYVADQLVHGVPLQAMVRHVLGLYTGRPGARAWRRYLSENCHKKNANEEVLLAASRLVDQSSDITYK